MPEQCFDRLDQSVARSFDAATLFRRLAQDLALSEALFWVLSRRARRDFFSGDENCLDFQKELVYLSVLLEETVDEQNPISNPHVPHLGSL